MWTLKKSSLDTLYNYSKIQINNMDINECILLLPIEVRNKIGIYCIKTFWKSFIPLTAKVPSWYNSYKNTQLTKFNMIQNNIHFLHLDCNILPSMKEYIMGCQCNYCKEFIRDDDNLLIIYYMFIKEINDNFPSAGDNIFYEKYKNSFLNFQMFNPYYDLIQ